MSSLVDKDCCMEELGKYLATFRQRVYSNDFEAIKKDFRTFTNLLFADGIIYLLSNC